MKNLDAIGIERGCGIGIAYGPNRPAGNSLMVYFRLGGYFSRDNKNVFFAEDLARDTASRILLYVFVQDGIGNIIAHLVGVSFCHGFRCKYVIAGSLAFSGIGCIH